MRSVSFLLNNTCHTNGRNLGERQKQYVSPLFAKYYYFLLPWNESQPTCWSWQIVSHCEHEAERMTWGDMSSHWGCISGQDHGEWGDFGQPWQQIQLKAISLSHEPSRIEILGLRSGKFLTWDEHAASPGNAQSPKNLVDYGDNTLKIYDMVIYMVIYSYVWW